MLLLRFKMQVKLKDGIRTNMQVDFRGITRARVSAIRMRVYS